jgi:hypothetical protein
VLLVTRKSLRFVQSPELLASIVAHPILEIDGVRGNENVPVSHEMLTAVVGVGIQNPHRRTVGSQLLTSLIINIMNEPSLSAST